MQTLDTTTISCCTLASGGSDPNGRHSMEESLAKKIKTMQKGGRVLLGLGQRAGDGRHRVKKYSRMDCRNSIAIQTWSVVCEGQIQAWSNIQENERFVAACLQVRHAVEQQNHRSASEKMGEELPPSHHAQIAERHESRSCGAGQKGNGRRNAGTAWDVSGGRLSQKLA